MIMNDIVQSQVIATVKNDQELDKAIASKSNVIFLLTGDLHSTPLSIEKIRERNKFVFLHVDLIDGLAISKNSMKYVAKHWRPDGIISTRTNTIKQAKLENLLTIQRIFLIDNNALNNGISLAHNANPDAIEILPGLMPEIIHQLTTSTKLPIIAGGLVNTEQQIMTGLKAGALAISASSPNLWNLNL